MKFIKPSTIYFIVKPLVEFGILKELEAKLLQLQSKSTYFLR